MATVIKQMIPKGQGGIKGSTIYDLLVQYHSFVRVETESDESDEHVTIKKLYYTENSYLKLWWKDNVSINSTEFRMSVVTPNFEVTNICFAVHGSDYYYKFIVSAAGDISFLQDSAELVDGEDYRFSLVKCKNAIEDDEMWGVYIPMSEANYSVKCLALDDTTSVSDNISVQNTTSSAVLTHSHYSGWNVNAQMVLLMPLCATTSKYLSQNTFIMYFTPQRYYGDTVIDGKHYYCVGLIAMLDE